MSRKLEGKIIIVTGGSTGIGRAAALRCAADGAAVVIADVNVDAGRATLAEIEKAGRRASFVQTDVTDGEQVRALVAATVGEHGRLDGAFNNAGIEGGFANTIKMSEEAFDRTIAVNLKGVWLCMKAQIEQFLAQGTGGAIVNTASVAGLVGTRGGIAYCASKHGVVGMTKCAALDFARKRIRVNAVCPGIVHTPMLERLAGERDLDLGHYAAQQPVGRLGEAREIGDAVAWLLSDEASFVTGLAMPVDGGYTSM
jgi:NAD(P)-dependent dehydrogenase (short-subunit alcohol dehydrogenase family)